MNNHKHSNNACDDNNDTTISSYALHEMLFTKKRNVNLMTLKVYLQLYPESVMIPYRYRMHGMCCQKRRKKEGNNTTAIGEEDTGDRHYDDDDNSVAVLTPAEDDDVEININIYNKLPLQIALEYCTSDWNVVYTIWEVYRDQVLLQQQREENNQRQYDTNNNINNSKKKYKINGILHISCRNAILHSTFIIEYITIFPYSVQEYYHNDDSNMLLLPLHIACQYNAPLRIIKKLIEVYPIAISLYTKKIENQSKIITTTNEKMIQHLTPLMIAIQNNQCDFNVIEFLIHYAIKKENNNNNNALYQKDSLYGQAPLHMACSYQHHPINISNHNININMNHYIATLIARTCPSTVQIEDNFGNLPIHSLCISIRNIDNKKPNNTNVFNMEVIHTLIRQYPISLCHMNHNGDNPLLLLLSKRSYNVYDNNHITSFSNKSVILYQLLQLFCTIDPSILSMKHPNTGRLPLHFLCDMLTITDDVVISTTDATTACNKNNNEDCSINCNNNLKGYMILLEHFIKLYPNALLVQDHINGDLPIHILLRNNNKLINIPKVFLTFMPSIVYTMNYDYITPLYYICEYYNNFNSKQSTLSGGHHEKGTNNNNNSNDILNHRYIQDDMRKTYMDKRLIDIMKIYNINHNNNQSRQSIVRDDDDNGRIDNSFANNFYTSTNNNISYNDDERKILILQQQEELYQIHLQQQQKENDQLILHQLNLIYNMVRKCPDIVL